MSQMDGNIKRLLFEGEVYVSLSDLRTLLSTSADRWTIDGRPWAAALVTRLEQALQPLESSAMVPRP